MGVTWSISYYYMQKLWSPEETSASLVLFGRIERKYITVKAPFHGTIGIKVV